jgi:hypothetical protein
MSNTDFGPSIQGNAQGIDWQNADRTVGMVNFQDRNTHAIFYWDKMHNAAKSREHGRPWYDNVVMVRIGNPGERLNIVIRPATQGDKQRFALQWAQFQQQKEQRPEGTPLNCLFPENPAMIGNFEGAGVYTVEQLAGLSGNAIETLGMGTQGYVNQAQQYLANAEKGIRNSQLRKMQEDHEREVNALKHQLEEQGKRIDQLLEQQRRGVARQQQYDAAGGMERPVHLGQGFDPQQEMISNIGREQRPAPQAEAKPKRTRQKLAG